LKSKKSDVQHPDQPRYWLHLTDGDLTQLLKGHVSASVHNQARALTQEALMKQLAANTKKRRVKKTKQGRR